MSKPATIKNGARSAVYHIKNVGGRVIIETREGGVVTRVNASPDQADTLAEAIMEEAKSARRQRIAEDRAAGVR